MICIPSPGKKGVGGVEAEWQERPHSAPRVQRRPEEVTEGRGQLELEREVINIIIIINVIIIINIIIIITWMMAMSSLMPEMSGEQNWPEPPEQSKEKLY